MKDTLDSSKSRSSFDVCTKGPFRMTNRPQIPMTQDKGRDEYNLDKSDMNLYTMLLPLECPI
jgi:hypothetical protein